MPYGLNPTMRLAKTVCCVMAAVYSSCATSSLNYRACSVGCVPPVAKARFIILIFVAHLHPFEGARLDRRSLDFTGIDPFNPMRMAIAEDEKMALKRIFKRLTEIRREQGCTHCILVGHNAHFDLGFLQAAVARTGTKNQTPFHSFSVLDTVTLGAIAYGQTVLARACRAANIEFDGKEAHSALYDTQKTAELFCHILNSWPQMLLDTSEQNP